MSDEKVWRGWADWRKDRFYNFSSGKIYNFQIEAVALPAADYEALLADNTKLFQCAEDWRVQYEEAHERENELQDKVNALLRELTTARTALAEAHHSIEELSKVCGEWKTEATRLETDGAMWAAFLQGWSMCIKAQSDMTEPIVDEHN